MAGLSYERCCAEIVAQTELLASSLEGADLAVAVPSCPGWTAGQLLRHLGGGQRWAEAMVRNRVTEPLPDDGFRDLSAYTDEDPAELGPWLVEGAAHLARTLREAGPDLEMWTPVPCPTTAFYARRFAHETLIHRADGALALGAAFTADPEVAADALDEWMELGALPVHFEIHPRMRELLGPGRTIQLSATDADHEAASWLIDLTGDAIAWRRARERAAVTVRAPLTDLLLLVYRRRSPHGEGVDVLGDRRLLDFWLDRVAFG